MDKIATMTNGEIDQAADVLRVLSKRWTLPILKNMGPKTMRFSGIKKALAGVSSTVLSERLLELERMGLITKQVHVETPPRVEYRSTDRARKLEAILEGLSRWNAPQIPNA